MGAKALAAGPAPTETAPAGGHAFLLNGAPVVALREGGLWLCDARALVVSDLHLEKGSALATRGTLLPPHDTAATLDRVEALVDEVRPDLLISLGDTFHDRDAGTRTGEADRARLLRLAGRVACIWVAGNHDPEVPSWLPGRRVETLALGPLTLCHEPSPGPVAGEIAGHLHPCARVVGRAGPAVRRRCFATDGARLVMPAMGAYAGGLNLMDPAWTGLFASPPRALVMGRGRVHAIALSSLRPDGPGR